jgi:hypothetical protein
MRKSWKTPKIGATLAACTIFAAALSYMAFPHGKAANAASVPDLLSALPSGAPTLVYLDLAAVRNSSFYQHRPDKGPLAIPNQDYADFVRSTGFDFEKDLDRVVVASWPASSAKEKARTVSIAEGRFDQAKIRDYAVHKGKIEQQQGHEVFLFPVNGSVSSSVTFLDNHRIAIVGGPSVAPLFAANSDPASGDPARERAARVDGAALFVVARVPPIPENTGAPQAAPFVALARSVQWITLAARPEGDNLRLSLEGECDSATSALQLKSALELLRMFGSAGLDSPKSRQSMDPAAVATLKALLTSAEVTQAAERVRVLFELTPDVFKLSQTSKPQ